MTEDLFHLGVRALIKNSSEQVLLLQVNPAKLTGKNDAYWDLPGGRVQRGQTVEETLQREVAEETGITEMRDIVHIGTVLSNIRIPVKESADGKETVGLLLSVHTCALPANEANIQISEEHLDYCWYPLVQAAELLKIKYPQDFCDLIAQL
jgi:8-oxo-dGTP diphosphatase